MIESATTQDEAVQRARALRPILEAGALDAERGRHLPAEMVDAFVASGLIRLGVPGRFGGHPLGVATEARVTIELAKGYGSMAWVGGFLIAHARFLGHFPEQAQIDVWESTGPDSKIASSFLPVGRAERVAGGWRVSGDWPWASGSGHSQWMMLFCMFPQADGRAEPRWFMAPTEELTIVDTWHSSGLSGTGSDNVVADGVFVPEHRTVTLEGMREGRGLGAELYGGVWSKPTMSFGGMEQAAPTIGLARGAIEAWTDHLRLKANTYTQEQIAGSIPTQLALADATIKVDCAEMLLMRCLELVDSDTEITLDHRVKNRLAITHVPQLTMSALNELMQFAGASALRSESPLQRAWRDVRACSMHVLCNYASAGENFGRHAFGLPLNPLNPFY